MSLRPRAKVVLPFFDGCDDFLEVISAEQASEVADVPVIISDKYAATYVPLSTALSAAMARLPIYFALLGASSAIDGLRMELVRL